MKSVITRRDKVHERKFKVDFFENKASNEKFLFYIFGFFFRVESLPFRLYHQLPTTLYMYKYKYYTYTGSIYYIYRSASTTYIQVVFLYIYIYIYIYTSIYHTCILIYTYLCKLKKWVLNKIFVSPITNSN